MVKHRKSVITLLIIVTVCFSLLYFFYYHNHAKSSTTNVYKKIAQGSNINYMIIGDSIGRGAGAENKSLTWFFQWEELMKKKYGIKLNRYSIVQSGATAYEGFYLLNKANKPKSIDLIIVIFGENDRKYMNAEQFSPYYEGIIRKSKQMYPSAELITISESCLNNHSFSKAISTITNHYNGNHVDMYAVFHKSNTLKKHLTSDSVHPNGQGYQLYANTLLQTVKKSISNGKQIKPLPAPLFSNSNLKINEFYHFNQRSNLFIERDGYYYTTKKDATISFPFNGNNVGVKVIKTERGGELDVFIDGKFVKRISTWWPIKKERIVYITSGLPKGKHNITFTATGTKSSNNTYSKPSVQLSSVIVLE